MLTFPGYQVTEAVLENARTRLLRATRNSDGANVIIKCMTGMDPGMEAVARLRREYSIMSGLNISGVPAVCELGNAAGTYYLVMEDMGGISLETWIHNAADPDDPCGMAQNPVMFLDIACRIIEILAAVHEMHIVHKDINPANLLFIEDNRQIMLIDFRAAGVRDLGDSISASPALLEGSLAYMSPEQTGRMQRSLDHRTDLYALGVTLYELLTGRLPFSTVDPVELIHCHLARQPLPPRKVNPAVPSVISEVVSRLMAKDVEERYQSAAGLLADIAECRRLWESHGKIEYFPLGRHDLSALMHLNNKIYGREREIAALLNAFERAAGGSVELSLISGPAGIGKTALAEELHRLVLARDGYFVSGGFEPYPGEIPYYAYIMAFRSLARQMLTVSEARIHLWRQILLKILDKDTGRMVKIVPELETVLGLQLPAGEEAQDTAPAIKMAAADTGQAEPIQRFLERILPRCLAAMAQPAHPLVLFLDNLQWADPGSIHLLQILLTVPGAARFLIVGALRDGDIDKEHPLARTIEMLRQNGIPVGELKLNSLNDDDCQRWIAEILARDPGDVRELSREILLKTGGNPFFVKEMLELLLSRGFLHYVNETGRWEWDLEAIAGIPATDNVVEFMFARIGRLSPGTRQLIALAACIGRRFELGTISFLFGQSAGETARYLGEAVREGLVVPAGDSRPPFQEYCFAHERLQERIYESIAPAQRQMNHYRLGSYLASLPAGMRICGLFETVEHVNAALDIARESAERYDLAALNFKAGRKASREGNHPASLRYLLAGIELTGDSGWDERYADTLALHAEAAREACRCGDKELSMAIIEAALPVARTLLDRVPLYEIQADALLAQNHLRESLDSALMVARQLGLNFPDKPQKKEIEDQLLEIGSRVDELSVEEMVLLPPMKDPEKLAMMSILAKMAVPAQLLFPELFALIAMQQVRISLDYGQTPLSAVAFVHFGMLLCSIANDFDAGYRVGQAARALAAASGSRECEAAVYQLLLRYIRHWKEPLSRIAPDFLEAYSIARDARSMPYAASAMASYGVHMLASGCSLDRVADILASGATIIRQMNQEPSLHMNEIFRQTVLNLQGASADPCQLSGSAYQENTLVPRHMAEGNRTMLAEVYFCKMLLLALFGQAERAAQYAALCQDYLDGLDGTILVPIFHFYDSLIRLALYQTIDKGGRAEILNRVILSQQKMRHWAEQAPANHLHRYYLVEAEYFKVLGRNADAMDAYDQAIRLAQKNGFCHEEALALELAARFYHHKGNPRIAALYMKDACLAYQHWGSQAKVEALEKQFDFLLREKPAGSASALYGPSAANGGGAFLAGAMDLASTIKASQAISQEIVLDRLLDRMMSILLENAGAERGFLVLKSENQMVVEAEMEAGDQAVRLLQSVPLQNFRDQFATAVVNLVIRTGENFLWNEEDGREDVRGDAYLQTYRPKSMLCLPIMSRGQIMGALYLENRLTTRAFTQERLEVLGMLASQAAFALENARLYAHLEQRVKERTRELAATNYNLQKEISQRLKAEENVRHMAYHDTLTGLPNRKLFQERLGQELARAERQNASVAVLFLDLDRFKEINDCYGHETGDMVLCEVAERLKKSVREFDMVSRLGGDEFTLFVTGIENQADILGVLDRIEEVFKEPLLIDGLCIPLSCSIGVSLFPQNGTHSEDLIWKADQAMYAAKRDSRHSYCFYTAENQS